MSASPGPTTTRARREGVRAAVLWSRKDIGDMFEGVITPLGQSFCAVYRRDVHPACVKAMGMRDAGDPALYYRVVDGRLYANVAYFAHLYSQTPLGRDLSVFTRAFADDTFDARGYVNPYGARGAGAREIVAWSLAQTRALANAAREATRLDRREPAATFARVDRLLGARRDDRALRFALDATLERFRDAYAAYMPVVFNAFTLQAVLSELARRWLGEGGAPLVAWSRSMLDARASERRALRAMARRARERGAEGIAGDVARFIARFGANGVQEMDLARPRWRDDPRAVHRELANLGAATAADAPAVPVAAVAGAKRLARSSALGSLTAALVMHARARERLRTAVVAAAWCVRAIVHDVAQRLATRGLLDHVERMADLELDDVRAVLRGGAPPPMDVLVARRREYERLAAMPPPPVTFLGD